MSSVRFRQRRENFRKSYDLLQRTLGKKSLNEIERGGLIQFFEVSFELAWKCLGDYLEDEGFTLVSPKQILRQAHQSGLLANGEIWLQALEDRNLTTHTYDEAKSRAVEQTIREEYAPAMAQLAATLETL